VALVLPILFLLVLGAVDIARALSAQQRLERAAHVAAQRLATDPTLDVTATVQQEMGLQSPANVSATTYYTSTPDYSDQVKVTASYTYSLLLRVGTLRLTSQAAGIAATVGSIPTVITNTTPMSLSVPAPSGTTVPTAVAGNLICAAYSSAVHPTPTTCPFYWPGTPASGVYTATVTQPDGVTSPPVTVTVP
jgi:Flp pilus assembly protein TadG